MCFPEERTKRFAALAPSLAHVHADTCCCGDCPQWEHVGTLERRSMIDIFIDFRHGKEVTILVKGKRKVITAIHDTGSRYIVAFEDRSTVQRSESDVILKVINATKIV